MICSVLGPAIGSCMLYTALFQDCYWHDVCTPRGESAPIHPLAGASTQASGTGGGIVDSPRPFRKTSSLAGSYMLMGYSMACGMHSNVA